ncbi:MAG: OsmC family protein [Synechococcaceae cyanobacterium]|nr:OsmC family protein [Synechococcaceae cyanobacterium]
MTTQTLSPTVNGVDVVRLKETIGAIRQTPSLADFRFRLHNRWQGGGWNRSTVKASSGTGQDFPQRDGRFTMEADEPEVLLSGDRGANPVEHLLHALASCVTTTAVYHAAARHIPIESMETDLEGAIDLQGFLGLDPAVPKGYRSVTMRMRVSGDLSEEQKREVMQLGCEFSPVFNMVSAGVPIQVELVD